MLTENLSLVVPDVRYFDSFQEAHREWDGRAEHGAGIRETDDVETPEGFAAWVDVLRRYETEVQDPNFVTCTFRWIVDGDTYVGSVALRHELNEFLLARGGHIGYGVRPSYRRRGVASWALTQMLAEAKARGMKRVLATCDNRNEASYRTILGHGGVLEDIRTSEDGSSYRRYWIEL